MDYLVFQLQASLASWGEPAVGEYRGTAGYPGQSALVGLLGAGLGLDRTDEPAHASLRDGLGYAVAVLATGSLLRDFQTVQVPPQAKLKGFPHSTRRHELAVPKRDLSTILSTRDYRQNAAWLVALCARDSLPDAFGLDALANALRQPKFVLYLGRKTCTPSVPLWPHVLQAATAAQAFSQYREKYEAARQGAKGGPGAAGVPLLEAMPEVQSIAFDVHVNAGVAADLVTRRKDRLIRRRAWQFGDREELIHICATKE